MYKGLGVLPDEVKKRVGKFVIQLNIYILKGLLLKFYTDALTMYGCILLIILFMFFHNTILLLTLLKS